MDLKNESKKIYLCIEHIAPFQIAMRRIGRIVTTPRLVLGEKRYCYVCGAETGPSITDAYIFCTELRPVFDQEEINDEWSCLDRLRQNGIEMEEALELVGKIVAYRYELEDE